MPCPKNYTKINIDVSPQTHRRIELLGKKNDWSKRKVVINAVRYYLKAQGYKGE